MKIRSNYRYETLPALICAAIWIFPHLFLIYLFKPWDAGDSVKVYIDHIAEDKKCLTVIIAMLLSVSVDAIIDVYQKKYRTIRRKIITIFGALLAFSQIIVMSTVAFSVSHEVITKFGWLPSVFAVLSVVTAYYHKVRLYMNE